MSRCTKLKREPLWHVRIYMPEDGKYKRFHHESIIKSMMYQYLNDWVPKPTKLRVKPMFKYLHKINKSARLRKGLENFRIAGLLLRKKSSDSSD